MCRSPFLLLVSFVALPVYAADVNLKPVYLQPLDQKVLVDRRGTPWFWDAEGVRSADNKVACKDFKGRFLLADTAGRFWFHEEWDAKNPLRYFDGKAWTDTGIAARDLYESSTAWVIARGATGFHVFDGRTWTESKVFDKPASGRGVFAEDTTGRVWYWLHKEAGLGDGDDGVWMFDEKKWTAHGPEGRRKGEIVEHLLPFADDWFLVVVQSYDTNKTLRRRAFPWSPSRKADDIASANPFDGLPLNELEYRGTDLDGVRYFRWLDRSHPDMPVWQIAGNGPPHLAVSPDRTVKKLSREQAVRLSLQPWEYHSTTGTRRMHTKLDSPVPVLPLATDRAVGRDKDGRVYLENGSSAHGTHRIWVLWAEKEKPGEVVRLTEYSPAKPAGYRERNTFDGLFTDAHGLAFARPYYSHDTVLAWDGTKWADTPVKRLPMAADSGSRAGPPPEHYWANFRWLGHTSGSDGRTLFARVKTKYVPEKEGAGVRGTFGGAGDEPKDDGKPFYQYETWTHLDGAWSDSHPPAELLKAKRKELIEGFQLPHTPLGPLPVISDGKRLWFASDWTVQAMDADGTVYSAELPKPEAVKQLENPRLKYAPPLLLAAFAKLDDKALLLAVAGPQTKTYRVQFRGLKPIGVQVTELDPLPVPFAVLHKATDGTVLAWADNQSRGYPLVHDGQPTTNTRADYRAVYQYRDGKWEVKADLAQPTAVSPDGTLWCEPYDPNNKYVDYKAGKTVLYRVSGAKAERFVWGRDELAVGFEKPVAGTTTFVLPQYGLANLEPGQDGAKPTLRVRYTGPHTQLEQRRPAITATGQVLFPTEWGKLFDASAK